MSRSSRPPSKRPKVAAQYEVISTDEREQLVEHREGRKGFRITRVDDDAAIEAICQNDAPAGFNSMHENFVKAGGSDVTSQDRLRVAIRFRRSLAPRVIEKVATRYRAAIATALFKAQVRNAWQS